VNPKTPPPAPAKDVVVHIEDGEAFLLDLESGVYFGLNPSGTIAWQALADGRDPVDALAKARPDISREQHSRDWDALRAELLREKLITQAGSPAPAS
jgi:Coenzyme PQQ synthesis protein D (PqqD)